MNDIDEFRRLLTDDSRSYDEFINFLKNRSIKEMEAFNKVVQEEYSKRLSMERS